MLNQNLFDLYAFYWCNYQSSLQKISNSDAFSIKPTNPYLLHVKNEEKWKNADIRLMVLGQETNSWYDNLTDNDITSIVGKYKEFVDSGYCWQYGGPFWNGVKRFETLLNNKFPNLSTSSIYNNVVKTGKAKGQNGKEGKGLPPDYIYDEEKKLFPVIRKEIAILKPNLVLFLSGPNRDFALDSSFGELNKSSLNNYSYRQLIKIDLPDVEYAFRTYHPNYLWRNNINGYFNSILDEIKFCV